MDNNMYNSTLAAAEEHKQEVIDQLTRLIDGIKRMIDSIEKTGYDDLVIPYIEAAAKQDIDFSPSISETVSIEDLNLFVDQLTEHLANLQETYTAENAFDLGDNVTSAESFANEILDLFKQYKDTNRQKFSDALKKKNDLKKILDEISERIRSIRQESLLILDTADTVFKKPSYRRKQFFKGNSKELKDEIASNERTRDMLESQINTLYLESLSIKKQIREASFSPEKYDSRVFSVIDLPSINPKFSDYR